MKLMKVNEGRKYPPQRPYKQLNTRCEDKITQNHHVDAQTAAGASSHHPSLLIAGLRNTTPPHHSSKQSTPPNPTSRLQTRNHTNDPPDPPSTTNTAPTCLPHFHQETQSNAQLLRPAGTRDVYRTTLRLRMARRGHGGASVGGERQDLESGRRRSDG